MKLIPVVLAAGQGTRMKSRTVKVVHDINGLPIITHVLRTLKKLQTEKIVFVLGYQADQVERCLDRKPDNFRIVYQHEQLGTGHALLCAREALVDFTGTVLVLPGDCPLISEQTLNDLVQLRIGRNLAVTLLAFRLSDPEMYGRVVSDNAERPMKIVEFKDATEQERRIDLVNAAIYAFDSEFLFSTLPKLGRMNAQGEYYLTDTIEAAYRDKSTAMIVLSDPNEALGINTRKDLATVAAHLRKRINDRFMADGVSLVDPQRIYIEMDVTIGRDTIIYPGAYIKRGSRIGTGCIVGPNCLVDGIALADGRTVGRLASFSSNRVLK